MNRSYIWNGLLLIWVIPLLALAQNPPSEVSLYPGRVGHTGNTTQTPVNQILTPFGTQLDLPGMRPQAMALSHNGKLLAVAGKTSDLVIVDPKTSTIVQTVVMPDMNYGSTQKEKKTAQVSYTGLIFSADDSKIYLSDVNGTVKIFDVDNHGRVAGNRSVPLPPANALRRKEEIPAGLALAADGKSLFICGNLSNKLLQLDLTTDVVTQSWSVGVAPYDVVLTAGQAIVSNWGGRQPDDNSLTGPAGRGTTVRVDPVRFIASEGSVSFVELNQPTGRQQQELLTGMQASALAIHPAGKLVVCANSNDDYLSVIDLAAREVVHKIWTKSSPADLFGASPNALVFNRAGDRLYVANGTQNAIGVIEFDAAEPFESKLKGLIPVGWFPGAIAIDDHQGTLYVANVKGLPKVPKTDKETGAQGFNSHHYHGSLSSFRLPSDEDLEHLTAIVARNLHRERVRVSLLKPRPNQPARAIPERIGEPSLIKHVVYIIKENRTFDQVFGAIGKGRGKADLCIFGRQITPNQHKLVDEFVLLDNTYCASILSADGHQWSTSAMSTSYLEKSFAGFPRSYPDGMDIDDVDALAYSPAGFIWDNALAHGVSIRNYGEFMIPRVRYRDRTKLDPPNFLACYRTWKGLAAEVIFESEPGIESIRPFSPTGYVGWQMDVPDQFRADFILEELKQFETQGEYPQLVIICLPNDHASGTKPGCPTPPAYLADNDLAFGRIVEGLSHSRFWPEMAIFSIEDDPQAGWDHISGHRTTAYVVSPFTKRQQVVSTLYNTTSILRTIEQILGLPPMNQFDASATPMFDCFSDTSNLSPFTVLPNNIPLDQMNPDLASLLDPILKQDALDSVEMNFVEVDRAPEDKLNRILWRAVKGTQIPYPAWAAGSADDEEDEEHGDEDD